MYLPFPNLMLSDDAVKKLSWLYEDIALQEAREAEDRYKDKVAAIQAQFKLDQEQWAREQDDKSDQ